MVSDAGTPLISDPGFKLVADALAQNIEVVSVPGASAVLAALVVAGLPTDRFFFEGFLPPKSAARRGRIAELSAIPGTLVFFESPRRVAATLNDLAAVLGPRDAAIARELTKYFETVRRGRLPDLAAIVSAEPPPKGEIVVLVGPPGESRRRNIKMTSMPGSGRRWKPIRSRTPQPWFRPRRASRAARSMPGRSNFPRASDEREKPA